MKRRLLVTASLAVASVAAYAQINSPEPEGYITRALSMYAQANYRGCIDQLSTVDPSLLTPAQTETLQYYLALATMHTDKAAAADMLQRWIARYPQSLLLGEARLALADCWYGTDTARALELYEQIQPRSLTTESLYRLTLHKAYCLLESGDTAAALTLYQSLTDVPGYAGEANFYCGYIEFGNRAYGKAVQYFDRADRNQAPGDMSDYFLSQIWYIDGDYDKALSTARALLRQTSAPKAYRAEACRVAGMSAYRTGQLGQAVSYLKDYASMVETPLPSAAYVLGLDQYQNGDYAAAIKYLTLATEQPGEAGQNAYLYLGQAYMRQDDYTAAAMAFNRALNMDYDEAVRETAYYNYAVASMHGGKVPFAGTVGIFTDFLDKYPQSRYAPDVQRYIINSYITDNDYEAALRSIDAMPNPSKATLGARQQVLYTLGLRALQQAQYDQALDYLQQARAMAQYDRRVDEQVSLLLGETYYRLGRYPESVKELQLFIKQAPGSETNLPLARYDLGYTLLAQKKYQDAAALFRQVVKQPGALTDATVADAYNRLGDALYQGHDYAGASKAYDSAYDRLPSAGDYPLYQKALMAGYQRDYAGKISTIQRLRSQFPASALIPSAMLELTEAYIQQGDNNKALETYGELVKTYPNTAQGRQGYLQMALVKLNSGDTRGAKADYREVIQCYPTSDEARQAVEQMKRITAADGTISEFMAFLNGVDKAPRIEESEADELMFENAEQLWLTKGDTSKMAQYVADYPDGAYRARAIAALLEEAAGADKADQAYRWACMLVEQYPSSLQVTSALAIKARVEEMQGRGNQAMRTWQQLAATASSAETLLKARMGVIRNARDGAQWPAALEAAQAVATSSGVPAADMAEALYTIGMAKANAGDAYAAREAWTRAAADIDQLYGVQSALALAQDALRQGDYTHAEQWAKQVANSANAPAYWIARGFIVLSDVYKARGEDYKARQYVEALRDNYTGNEADIRQMIQERLK